jgi:hypothetical protein
LALKEGLQVASNPTFTTPDEEDVLRCHECDVADLCSDFDRWMLFCTVQVGVASAVM